MYEKMSDEELLEILHEDEGAFNEIYRRYHKLVYFVAYDMCHSDADAKDVLQETFIKLRKATHDLREKNKFKYWLNVVTISKCKDLFKKNKYGNIDENSPYVKNNQIEERRYMLPEKAMHYDNDKKLLYTFIERLPHNQRQVLIMKYISDLSLQEIASALNISEGTVKSRLHYAKDSLRGMVENYNHQEYNKPLNFESMDLMIAGAFSYALKQLHDISWITKKPKLKWNQKKLAMGASMIAVISICVGGTYLLHDADKTDPSNAIAENIGQYRQAYFTLMDFAATESDMEAKSKEELKSVKKYVDLLKNSNNQYYRLLVKQNWINMYEKQLKK